MSAVACLLSIALSSDTLLSIEFSRGDSELALGESGRGSFKLLALPRGLPKKKPFLEGLIVRATLELLLEGGDSAVRMPTSWMSQDDKQHQLYRIIVLVMYQQPWHCVLGIVM